MHKDEDEADILGKTYAAKLRRMTQNQRDIADKLIGDILFKGLNNQLGFNTYIQCDSSHINLSWQSDPSPSSNFSTQSPATYYQLQSPTNMDTFK